MTFVWQVEIYIDEEEARDYAMCHSDEELPEDYKPSYEDYENAAREALEDDMGYYDLVNVRD